jgi:hypothetical protein
MPTILSRRSGVGWNFHDRAQSLLTRETFLREVSQKRVVGRHVKADFMAIARSTGALYLCFDLYAYI